MDTEKIYTGGGSGCWGDLLGAGFGGFLGAMIGNGGLFGNNNAGGAAAMAATQGTDYLKKALDEDEKKNKEEVYAIPLNANKAE